MVDDERVDEGVTEKVLFELEADEFEDICTHVLKLSEETCRDPEHVEFDALVVTVVVSIASLKVTAMVELTETEVAESAREEEETVGAVVSVESSSLVSSSLESSSLELLLESSSA